MKKEAHQWEQSANPDYQFCRCAGNSIHDRHVRKKIKRSLPRRKYCLGTYYIIVGKNEAAEIAYQIIAIAKGWA